MNHLQAAALRILESTPRERIRTHEQRAPESFRGGVGRARTPGEKQRMHERFEALAERGLNCTEIGAELRVDRNTVSKHLKAKGLHRQADELQVRRALIGCLLNEINPETGRRRTDREVAALLQVSRTTVQNHIRALKASGWKAR